MSPVAGGRIRSDAMQKIVLSKFVASCLLLTSLTWAQERPLGDEGDLGNEGEKGQTLHNGIEVPAEWPPRLAKFPTSVERDAVVPPYLTSPPAVIRIDVGRQLFVDDFLIADTTLTRTFHQPVYHPACPVLTPD